MKASNRQGIFWGLRFDIAIIVLIVVGWLIYDAFDEPSLRPTESEAMGGSRPPDRAEGDILLLLPDSPAAEAMEFDELDCSYAWFNSLWQYYGSFSSALTQDLSPEILAGRSVVIVPARVARNMPQPGVRALKEFVEAGGQVVLEQPGDQWASLAGVSTTGKVRRAQQITAVEGLSPRGPMRKHLPNVPLWGRLMPSPPLEPFPTGPSLLEVDGQPGLTVISVGEGKVFTLFFGFGCTVAALQQGLPTRGMQFTPEPGLVSTSTRVAHERMRTARVPYADLLELALFERLTTHRPIPRLWQYPATHAGAYIVMHPTPEAVRPALGWADAARKLNGTSTLFVASDRFNRTQTSIAEQTGAEIGLLWVRGITREPVVDIAGLGGLNPFANELDLNSQYTRLNLALPNERPLRAARVESNSFQNHWSKTFQQLTAARIRVDASFGPATREEVGYLFGTAYPFYPIDERGLPLPLLELPYLMQGSGVSSSRIEDFLVNSEAYFHQPITVSIPGDAMRMDPSPGVLLGFRDGFSKARAHRHWVTNVGEFMDFLSARRRSILTSQWNAGGQVLDISVNLLGSRSSTLEKGAFPGVAIPRTWDGNEIESVRVDNEEVSLRDLVTTGNSFDRILALGSGRHTIRVVYEQRIEPEAGEDEGPQ